MKPSIVNEQIVIDLLMSGSKRNCIKTRNEIIKRIASVVFDGLQFTGSGKVDIAWGIKTEETK